MKDISRLIKASVIVIFALLIGAIFKQNVQAATISQAGQATDVKAKIVSVTRSNDVLSQNDALKIDVVSNTSSNVQYRFFIYSDDDGQWKDLFNGYSSPVSGNTNYEVTVNNLAAGKYRFSVWVKMAGTEGSIQNSLGMGSYDDYYTFWESVVPKISVEKLSPYLYQNDDINLKLQSDINGQVQYRVFVNKLGTSQWVDKTNGYTSPVDGMSAYNLNIGKINDYGDYRISVWVKRNNKTGMFTNSEGYGNYDNYYCFNVPINPIPQIKDVAVSNMSASVNPDIKVLSSVSSKVQYRIFVNNSNTGWQDVTGGYQTPTDGNDYYTAKLNKILSAGNNKVSVWVKNAGTDGKVVNSQGYGRYDNYYVFNKVCLPKLNVVTNTSSLTEGDTLKLSVSAPELDKAQYRVFVAPYSTSNWTDVTQGYTSAVSGNSPYTISVNPPFKAGKYSISVWVKAAGTTGTITNSQGYGSYDNYYCFQQEVKSQADSKVQYVQTNYNYTLQQVLNAELNNEPVFENSNGQWVRADSATVLKYLNPANYVNDSFGRFQFLKLTYYDGITVDDLNTVLKGKGVLEGKGSVFLQAAASNNINPMYLVSHALLETGNGTSDLATGIVVKNQKVYNMFGIGAYDDDANYYGSQYAYNAGWFSVDAAITGGAKFVSSSYINNPKYNQDTLYKMRWNPNDVSHQYATDVKWAINQISNIKYLYDLCPKSKLIFDIPVFK